MALLARAAGARVDLDLRAGRRVKVAAVATKTTMVRAGKARDPVEARAELDRRAGAGASPAGETRRVPRKTTLLPGNNLFEKVVVRCVILRHYHQLG